VRALSLLDGPDADIRLVLAGDGDRSSVASEAERLGVAGRIDLPGWVDSAECARILLGASVFALPAREEGLPVALLEAMAIGLPSVVSPVGGIPDVFVEGRHGYFVAPDDPAALAEKLRKLVGDRDAARSMGAAARGDAASRFAVDVVARRVSEALAGALERRR
jgi:glycosyltransferase involved in cell wall biosynthesis